MENFEMWCWRRSVGRIMWEMKKYYIELRSEGITWKIKKRKKVNRIGH